MKGEEGQGKPSRPSLRRADWEVNAVSAGQSWRIPRGACNRTSRKEAPQFREEILPESLWSHFLDPAFVELQKPCRHFGLFPEMVLRFGLRIGKVV